MGVLGQNRGRGGAILTPTNSFLLFGVLSSYVCANFGENQSSHATVRVLADGQTQPCIPPGSLNRVPASAGVKAGKSPLPGGSLAGRPNTV